MTRSIRVPVGLGADPHILFLALLKQEGLLLPRPEYRFAPPRRWRFDYAWPGMIPDGGYTCVGHCRWPQVALEVEGGLEIVLVNDGSPDNSHAVCMDLVEQASKTLLQKISAGLKR